MATFGLFTRQEQKEKVATAQRSHALPVERLRALGLAGVKQMNPKAHHPMMEPEGPKRAQVYILGEAPGESEDEEGQPFVGESGQMLRPLIPREHRGKIRINNIVRTLPLLRKGDGGKLSRKPIPTEIECHRPSLEEDIEQAKPKVIIGTGNVPLHWVLGDGFSTITVCRGRRFPVKIREHRCWYYPVVHPAYIIHARNRDQNEKKTDEERVPPEEWERSLKWDIRRAFDDLEEGKAEEPEVTPPDVEELLKPVKCYTGEKGDAEVKEIVTFLGRMSLSKGAVGSDIETNRKRPYERGAKILTVSVGTMEEAIAFPIDHPQSKFTTKQRQRIVDALRAFYTSDAPKVFHNTIFDLEWLAWFYGSDMLRAGGFWHCTMQEAYSLDERWAGHSLNFLCAVEFGLHLKRLSQGKKTNSTIGLFTTEEGEIDRKELERTDILSVLKYNGLDVVFCHRLHRRQVARLKEEGQYSFYKKFQARRVATIVNAQMEGLVVNRPEVIRWGKELGEKERKVILEIKQLSEVRDYEKRYGEFSPTSNGHLVKIFKDLLGRKEGQRGTKYSTDKKVLADIKKGGKGAKLASLLLDMRKPAKLKSTYVDPLDITMERTVVFPDGKLHGQFNTTSTDTGRLSIEDPSLQNFPKRDSGSREIRSVVGCPPNHVILAIDEGQLEWRVLGMNSRDPVLVDSLFTGHDVHAEWAEKIIKRWDKTFKARGGVFKDFRADVKNQWVFPLCFGSSPYSCARNLEMPREIAKDLSEEFWHQLKRVKTWQREVIKGYEQKFYVECLSGRRRHGPMSYNMCINAPIQGHGSDMVVDAMNRISEKAQELDIPWLAPRLNIHDDLTFYVPKKKVEEALEIIVPEMLTFDYPWARGIPMLVEASVGEDWANMKEVGKFDGFKLGITKRAA
jgi:uracil-DNA glycosylase family 4